MTIKEIERLTGMTRANVRFYEEKGLLSPARQDNGYREYTEAEVDTLRRIALLRSLEVSLEEIRALQTGEKQLDQTLCAKLEEWEQRERRAAHAQQVCQAMRADHVSYDTLDAQKYLHVLVGSDRPDDPVREDRLPYPFYAWRRFFARSLDEMLYALIWNAVLCLVFHVNLALRSGGMRCLDAAVVLLLNIILEPLLLHWFGTTPGKWIFGLRLESEEGGRPSLEQARERTIGAIWYGEGLNLPIYGLVRLWKSARGCADGIRAPYDENSALVYTIRDAAQWRKAMMAGAMILTLFLGMVAEQAAAIPPRRGALTVADFAVNYNQSLSYYGDEGAMRLSDTAEWVEPVSDGGIVIRLDEPEPTSEGQPGEMGLLPEWQFETDSDGFVTGISFAVELDDSPQEIIGGFKRKALHAALAYIGAQPGAGVLSYAPERITGWMFESDILENVDFTYLGIHTVYEAEQQGYTSFGRFLWANEAENQHLRIAFSMQKE